jgi:hypothetical protein
VLLGKGIVYAESCRVLSLGGSAGDVFHPDVVQTTDVVSVLMEKSAALRIALRDFLEPLQFSINRLIKDGPWADDKLWDEPFFSQTFLNSLRSESIGFLSEARGNLNKIKLVIGTVSDQINYVGMGQVSQKTRIAAYSSEQLTVLETGLIKSYFQLYLIYRLTLSRLGYLYGESFTRNYVVNALDHRLLIKDAKVFGCFESLRKQVKTILEKRDNFDRALG